MRVSQLFCGIATSRTLVASGLALFVAALPACDSKSGSDGQPAAATAENGTVTPGLSTPGGGSTLGWKKSRPANKTFQVKRTARPRTSGTIASQSLRAAYIGNVQAEAGAEYSARPTRTGGTDAFRFDNRKHDLSADLGQNGVRIDINGKSARGSATFRLASIGCKDEVGTRIGAARPVVRDGRVTYSRDGIVEWYKNGPLGVEQGFDIAGAPGCREGSRDQAIELKLEVGHRLHPTLMHGKDGSDWLELRDDTNKIVMRYSDLFAEDADQKLLPTKLSFANDVLTLRVDDRGARYPLHVDPLIWAEVGSRYYSVDPDAGDLFGSSIAISGDHAVIGAPGDDEGCAGAAGCNSGAAYIFVLNSQGSWTPQAKIPGYAPATAGDPGAEFGTAVAIADIGGGDKRIVVGAPADPGLSSGSGTFTRQGLVVWFRGRESTWITEGQFNGYGDFGASVGVSGNYVIAGGPTTDSDDGVAIVYEPDLRFVPPYGEAVIIQDPGNGGKLGTSVALDGDIAVAGAPVCCSTGSPAANVNQGAAYAYQRDIRTNTWSLVTGTLTASDGAAGDNFGSAVAISGLSVVVGAPSHAIGGSAAAGGAYVFENIIGTWGEVAQLHSLTGDINANDFFGSSVSISSNLVAVGSGAAGIFGSNMSGAGWVFEKKGTAWGYRNLITSVDPLPPHPPMPTDLEFFGTSIAIDRQSGHVLVGAYGNSDMNPNAGAFYDFIQRKEIGEPCGAARECATDFCVDGVCCDSACGGGNPNDCQACVNTVGGGAETLLGAPGFCGTANNATVCHNKADLCDQVVMCDGASQACGPAAAPIDTPCRAAIGGCDVAEVCNGTDTFCPKDDIRPAQFECRAAAGVCDVAELCNGEDKSCPADLRKPSYTICRLPSGGECDSFEVCNGESIDCPEDQKAVDNVPCSTGSCQQGLCRAEADLGIAIAGPANVEPNRDLSYTLTVTNYGRSPATSIAVNVNLSDDATLVTSSGSPATCQSIGGGAQCTIASLAAEQSTSITLLVHPAGQKESMRITASVQSTVVDPNLDNNIATLTQNLLSPRLSGGGAGCSAVPGGGAMGLSHVASLVGLALLVIRRRRRTS